MRRTKCVRGIAMLLALVTVLGAFVVFPVGTTVSSAAGLSAGELAGILNAESYDAYAKRYNELLKVQRDENNSEAMSMEEISIDIFNGVFKDKDGKVLAEEDIGVVKKEDTGDFSPADEKFYVLEDLDGYSALFTPDSGSVTWTFKVPQLNLSPEGKDDLGYLYMLKIEYYPINIDDNVATVERSLSIGTPGSKEAKVPFAEARSLSFSKNWVYGYTDEDDIIKAYKPASDDSAKQFSGPEVPFKYDKDKGGNDLRYTAIQDPKWMTYYAQDVDGFHHGSFYFFFEANAKLAKDGTEAPDMEHTITISGSRENLAIRGITLVPAQFDKEISYEDYLAKYAGAVDHAGTPDQDGNLGEITLIEAEFPSNVSDTSVYPSNDRSSAITSPSLPQSQLMNTIGAESYNTVGQWASYRFTVSKSGWYNMTMRYRQNLLDGLFVSRSIKLWSSDREDKNAYGLDDGTPTAPFREAHLTRFNYSKNWEVENLGAVIDGEKTDFRFYFKEGVEYVVRFEVGLGDLAEIIKEVEDSLAAINNCYLSIIKLTGASPDQYRDYGFKDIMPEVISAMLKQSAALYSVADRFVALAGTKGSQVATLEQIAFLLNKMGSKESEVAKNLTNLKSNIGTLGTWLNNVKQQGLLVDYVNIQPLGAEQPRENATFFQSVGFEISAFFYSFFVDYNTMGVKEEANIDEDAGIDVWLAYGRDQALIWRSLIDSEFTPKEQIPVRLKLVVGGTLLPSVLSGRGPDVYIGLGSGDVINYAIRNAIEPIDGEEGYVQTYGYDVTLTDKVENSSERLYYVDPSRYDVTGITYDAANPVPYEYLDEDGNKVESTKYRVPLSEIAFNYANTIPISLLGKTYGVPETTNFSMLFYRMDVLAELGVEIPDTWDDLLALTTTFQSNNMQIGLAYSSALTTFIYQKGGSQWKYEDESSYLDPERFDPAYAGAEIGLGSDIALEAFRYCARLYTDYSFPVAFDAANRFRTGEMPLVITDYVSMYNQLTVFATEIRGLWSFWTLPGFEQYDDDGNLLYKDQDGDGQYTKGADELVINNCAVATLTATVLLKKKGQENNYADAWKYMKWQADASAQASYGNQMVALIGPAAKYATANSQAIRNLSWTSTELNAILAQFENLAAVPSFPGSYIISRYVEFAFLAAVNNGADPVDELNGYITTINKELTRKRKEFKEFNIGTMEDFKDGTIPPWEIPKSGS
ncbi:MAG: extracellular solute-binding protein [Clostridia bacterium]|nr:extracellular solute-binding protein [Clostridia bacterium]